MSRVTIEDIYYDLYGEVKPKDGLKIEVVPLKIVELIIEWCDSIIELVEPDADDIFEGGKIYEARDIKHYAEFLLKEFEEDK